MTHAYLLERMYRTTSKLATGLGDLRERLPEAFNNGFGTIGEKEIREISFDLAQHFKSVRARLRTVQNDEVGWAAASAAEMSDAELVRLANDILDIEAMTNDAVAHREVSK